MIFRTRKDVVGIEVSDKQIILTNLKEMAGEILVHAYHAHNLDYEIQNLTIYNPSILVKYIEDFLEKNRLRNPIIAISLDDSQVYQSINHGAEDTADTQNYAYQFIELDADKQLFYIAGINHFKLFQYKLIAMNFNLIAITTNIMCCHTTLINNNQQIKLPRELETLKEELLQACYQNSNVNKFIKEQHNENLTTESLVIALGLYYNGKAYETI